MKNARKSEMRRIGNGENERIVCEERGGGGGGEGNKWGKLIDLFFSVL